MNSRPLIEFILHVVRLKLFCSQRGQWKWWLLLLMVIIMHEQNLKAIPLALICGWMWLVLLLMVVIISLVRSYSFSQGLVVITQNKFLLRLKMVFIVVGSPSGGNGDYERNKDSGDMGVILPAVLVPLIIVIVGVSCGILYFLKKKRRNHNLNRENVGNETQQLDSKGKEATT